MDDNESLRLQMEELKRENEKLKAQAAAPPRGTLYCKVSQKGAISVYGLQRMPVTLYVEQWTRLLDYADEVRKFATEHSSELSRKGDKKDEE